MADETIACLTEQEREEVQRQLGIAAWHLDKAKRIVAGQWAKDIETLEFQAVDLDQAWSEAVREAE